MALDIRIGAGSPALGGEALHRRVLIAAVDHRQNGHDDPGEEQNAETNDEPTRHAIVEDGKRDPKESLAD